MLELVRGSLVAKLAILLIVAIVVGFSLSGLISIRLQVATMERLNVRAAESLATGLAASVRSSMLSGNGLVVRELLADTQRDLVGVKVRVYAPSGEEVFGAKKSAAGDHPAHVDTVLRSGTALKGTDGSSALPIANASRCKRCHAEGELRGVLTINTSGARVPLDGKDPSLFAVAAISRAAFTQIMTARHEDDLDYYFRELVEESHVIDDLVVYSADGVASYGNEKLDVPKSVMEQAMRPGGPFVVRLGATEMVVQPLDNEAICRGCHDDDAVMRGAIFFTVNRAAFTGEPSLIEVSSASLDHVMLAGLGRLVNRFLDSTAATGVVSTLTLHDREGRLFHDDNLETLPPPSVARALSTREVVRSSGPSELAYVMPLTNEKACQRCHGSDRPVRGAIEVVMDTSREAHERLELQQMSAVFAALTVLMVFAGLYAGLSRTVLKPVGAIGEVARQVGEGHLDVRADEASKDEMGRLAGRLNQMIAGLKQKIELSKFVSAATVRHVSETEGAVSRSGERRRITVLFSDIRGFTAFSETREPEEVVAMLNDFLHVQAVLVEKHGGDIDKFVGDELMARFTGPDMEARATRCAVEMVEAVAARNRALVGGSAAPSIRIGVGINTGDMVIGAMGPNRGTISR